MVHLFHTVRIRNEKWRIVSLVLCVLPVAIFIAGAIWPFNSDLMTYDVVGKPKGVVFVVVWTLLVALWVFAGVVASMRFDRTSLIVYQASSNAALASAVTWLGVQNGLRDKESAAQILLLVLLFSVLTLVSSATAENDLALSRTVVSMTMTPLPVWIIGATLFSYIGLNQKVE
jgi:tryptophan-rich sensory protein